MVIKNLTATNGTFSGKINATSGEIGGWTIENNRLISDYMIIDSTEGISTTISRNGYQGLKIRNTGISFYSQYEQNRFIGQIFSTRNTSLGTYTLFIGGAQSDILALGTRKADGEGYSSSLTISTNSEVQPYPLRINDEFDVTEASHFKDSVHIESATLYFETSSNGIIFREPGWMDGFRMSPTFSGSGDSQYMSFAVSGSTGGGTGEWTGNGITAFRVYIGSGNTEFFRPIYCTGNNMVVRSGNQNTTITNNWIGFYRASDGGRVGWMGANATNDLYISPEKGTCYIGSNLYVASNADRWGYYLQINSGGGTYAGNGYIFVNSSNGYLALGQGDAYIDSSGGRLYLKPQNQVTYDMFVEPRTNRKTTLGSSGKRFYRLYTGLAVDVSSDRRIKEDFTTFDDRYLRLFELLQPTIYKLKYLPEDKSKIGGFIAQDVEEAMKQCGIDKREFGIYKYDSENDEYSLIYDMFIPLTVHYVQEQSKLVNHLKNEVALLKSKINI